MADGPVGPATAGGGVEGVPTLPGPSAAGAIPETDKPNVATKDSGDDDGRSALKDWVELLIRAGFWALLIYLFIFQVSIVDGPSMQPNFQQSDRLVIDKLTYRFSSIQRFDVIVFQAIDTGNPDRVARDYIKRVIGLPGETVKIRNGYVYINDGRTEWRAEEAYGPRVDHHHRPYDENANTWVVPEGHYFVLGDNRPDSKDSRQEAIGFVPVGQVKGLVRCRFMPGDRITWFKRGS